MTTKLLERMNPILITWIFLSLLGVNPASATETVTYLHTDMAGSPIAATDSAGNVIWRENYRPYGERTKNQPASAGNRQFFHAKPFDQDSGLSYFGARYYDPVVGRFMGVYPKGFDEKNLYSFNRYAYGNNNPYRFLDPNGQWSTDAHNYFIDQAFNQMPDRIKTYMKEGSRAADALYNQGHGSDHVHSMWPENGSQEQMVQLRSEYIRERLSEFNKFMTKANEYRERGVTGVAENFEAMAWRAYGEALHPIMDSTSPVHNQVWRYGDRHRHGDYEQSQETRAIAPQYRDETVRRMQNMGEFISQ